MNIVLCVHKMNPISCPSCFRMKPAVTAPKPEQAHLRPNIPLGNTVPIGEATMRATQRTGVARPSAQMPNGQVKEFKEPYSSAHHPPPVSADKVWEPPVRDQIIDKQPEHPHLNETKAQSGR